MPTEGFDPVPTQLLRKYIAYARKYVHPSLSSDAADVIQVCLATYASISCVCGIVCIARFCNEIHSYIVCIGYVCIHALAVWLYELCIHINNRVLYEVFAYV